MSSDDYVVVVAIDIGTAYSGYSFSTKSSAKNVRSNKNWGAKQGFAAYKTPTCVLLDKNKKFKSFGYDAQTDYANLTNEEARQYYYFHRFKMVLHTQTFISRKTTIKTVNGVSFPALKVFAVAIKYLKDHFFERVKELIGSVPDMNLIRWVLTVPAIWSDASKQFMREAALEAGLMSDVNSKQLVIALEPEAAGLFCRSLDVNEFKSEPRTSSVGMKTGSKYLVVDAGGGTLDVTAHELLPGDRVKELYHATGGAMGGTRVEEEFIKQIKAIFGDNFISEFQCECSPEWLEIVHDIETKKRQVSNSSDASTNVILPYSFFRSYEDNCSRSVDQAISSYRKSDVTFFQGHLQFPPSLARKMFKSVVSETVDHVQSLLSKPQLRNVQYIFMVGGFSESPMLRDAMIKAFKGKCQVLVPETPVLSVMKGAVAFGHQQDIVRSRKSKLTYGVEHLTAFVEGKHPEQKAKFVEGVKKCQNLFSAYVTTGDDVTHGFSKTSSFKPTRAEQSSADVEIYATQSPCVEYTTESGCYKMGDVNVHWDGSGLDREVEITMVFGGTEITVTAKTFPGGNSAETTVDFLS